jgi:hypothetical protein
MYTVKIIQCGSNEVVNEKTFECWISKFLQILHKECFWSLCNIFVFLYWLFFKNVLYYICKWE